MLNYGNDFLASRLVGVLVYCSADVSFYQLSVSSSGTIFYFSSLLKRIDATAAARLLSFYIASIGIIAGQLVCPFVLFLFCAISPSRLNAVEITRLFLFHITTICIILP